MRFIHHSVLFSQKIISIVTGSGTNTDTNTFILHFIGPFLNTYISPFQPQMQQKFIENVNICCTYI